MKRQATFTCLFIFSILMMPGCDDSEPRLISVTRMEDPDVIEYWGRVFIADADVNFGDVGIHKKFGNDAFAFNTASIADDTLTISVSYAGGCKAHDFTLILPNRFPESEPVRLSGFIAHQANADSCEAYPTETYHFDLKPIKKLYQAMYQRKAGSILLQIQDAPNGELLYTFD